MKNSESKKIWIEKGYDRFALFGHENLSINKISKEIGCSRASFYHFFGDIDDLFQNYSTSNPSQPNINLGFRF